MVKFRHETDDAVQIATWVPVTDAVINDTVSFPIRFEFKSGEIDPIVGDGDAADVWSAIREWEQTSFMPPKVTIGLETLSRIHHQAGWPKISGGGPYYSGPATIWGAPATVVEGSGFIVEAQ
jgi:hypothetical protein